MGVIMEEEFILKKYFIQYMKNIKGLSDASVKHYIGSLSTISKFLRELLQRFTVIFNFLSSTSLFNNVNLLSAWLRIRLISGRFHKHLTLGLVNAR